MDWRLIDGLVQESLRPLPDPWLEGLNAEQEPYCRFLYLLASAMRPEAAVELGTYLGTTAVHLAAADVRTFGVDSTGYPKVRQEAQRRGLPVRFLFCDTLGAAVALGDELRGKVGIVFQDSHHHAEPSWQEWLYWSPLLAPGWVWVCDDVSASFKMPDEPRGMVGYWERLPGRKRLYGDVLHKGGTVGVMLP